MGAFGYNPKKNPALDTLRREELMLAGFPAAAYGDLSRLRSVAADIERRKAELGPRVDMKMLAREAAERLAAAASDVFSTRQRPFIAVFGTDAYAVFVPDLMSEGERAAFQTSVALKGLKLARIRARKNGGEWHYELCA